MPETARTVIERNFLQTKWRAEEDRMKEAGYRLDLYKDDYEEIIRETMASIFHKTNYNRLYYHVNGSQNILKRVINEISTIYKAEPQRELNQKSDVYDNLMETLNLDVVMNKVNRYTNLLNECIVKVGWRNNSLTYDLITPTICGVIQDENDPTIARAIYYQVAYVNTLGNKDIDYHYWSDEGDYFIFDKEFRIKQVIYEGNSPYHTKDKFIMPFVVFHRQEPDDTFWDQDSGRDLYNAAVSIGVKMTLFDYYFKTCSFKQITFTGKEIKVPDKQIMDPTTVLVGSGEGAQWGTLDIQNNMTQLRDALIYQVNSVVNNYGISSDQWTLSIAEMSGIALKIRNRALLEKRQEQMPTYRKGEKELFEVIRIVNNAHSKKKIPEKAEFSMDFGEIEFPEDPKDRLELMTSYLKAGLISLGQFYMEFNPDIKDEKEAEKMMIKNLEAVASSREKYTSLDEMLNRLFREQPAQLQTGGEEGEEGGEE